jgi:60 kDa SS-A/Ro ribonucleoprotein
MSVNYSQHLNTQKTPQTQPLFGRTDQVVNNAGGYVFQISPEQQLTRFLILGAEGGTYYAPEKALTQNNANNILAMLQSNGTRAVNIIREISVAQPARAPKNDACVFALSIAAVHGSDEVKERAFAAVSDVCRIPTDLFAFIESYQALGGGWGRRMKRTISEWYTNKSAMDLAHTMTKYQNRNGWTHRDVLRLAHVTPQNDAQNQVFHYAVKGELPSELNTDAGLYLEAVSLSLSGKLDKKDIIKLIETFNLPREVISTNMLNERDVWAALLQKMPIRALIRNLPTMTRVGLISPMSSSLASIQEKMNEQALVRGRIHPISVLTAMEVYRLGRSVKGSSTWTPVPRVLDILEDSFYKSFGAITPLNKRTMIALDVSGSMTWTGINGVQTLTPRVASAAMAMTIARTEPNYVVTAFDSGITPIDFIRKNSSLTEVCDNINRLRATATDCSLPMIYALEKKIPVDIFQVFTDNETYAGRMHPSEALKQYRREMGINAKLVVNGMTATQFSIADPKDPGMLDVCGFDTAAPTIIREFTKW